MKCVALLLCVLVALSASQSVDEDETEILSSFHKYADGFKTKFQSFMNSKPTGRPRDIYNTVRKHWEAAAKSLEAARPTGRPFRPHKERAQHNHATWQLSKNWQLARNQLRKYNSELMKLQKAAAMAKGDETEIISSPFSAHAANFRTQFEDMFSNLPAGSPDEVYYQQRQFIDTKYHEQKDNLKNARPTGRPTELDKKNFNMAYKQLKDHADDAEDKVKAWRKQAKAEIYGKSKFAVHPASFKTHFEDMFANRPTGRPDLKDFKDKVEDKYEELKAQLKAMKPTGRPSKQDEDHYDMAKDELKDHMDDAKDRIKAWKKQEQAVAYGKSKFAVHPASFKTHFEDMFANRPTGRPELKDFKNKVEDKYEELKDQLKAMKPKSKHSDEDEDHYDMAKDELHDHMEDAEDKIKAWRKKLEADMNMSDEDETEVISSSFSAHAANFRTQFENMFSNLPAGSPEEVHKQLVDFIDNKYKEERQNLKNARPTGRPSRKDRKEFNQAHKELKNQAKEAEDKADAWKKQANADLFVQSPFAVHPADFRAEVEDMSGQRPTGRPELKKFKDAVEKKYKEAKDKLSAMRPTGRPSKQDKQHHKMALSQLRGHMNDARTKINSWRKQVQLDMWNAKHVKTN